MARNSNPFKQRRIAQKNPYGGFKRIRRLHDNGTFSKRYDFGGKKLGANHTHLALRGHRRRRFGGKMYANYTRDGKFRPNGVALLTTRRIYSRHLSREFQGNVRDRTIRRISSSSDSTWGSWSG